MPAFKGRILFFHGYAQSSLIFYAKTSALRKKLIKLGYKCIYLNGPCKLTPADFPSTDSLSKFNSVPLSDNGETFYRAWWIKPANTNDHVSLEEGIDTVRDYIDNNRIIDDEDLKQDIKQEDQKLPILGLIGFSQGSGFAGLLMNKFDQMFGTDLKFSILYSGFKLDTTKGTGNENYNDYYTTSKNPKFKVLHVLGELDTVVSDERSMKLYDYSKDYSTILKHPGGHFVPNSKIYVEQVTNWINQLEQDDSKSEKPDNLDDILNMMDNIGKV